MKVVGVPGAMQEILRRHKKNMKKDAKYRRLAIYEAKRRSGLKQFDALAGEDRQVVVSTRRGVNPPR